MDTYVSLKKENKTKQLYIKEAEKISFVSKICVGSHLKFLIVLKIHIYYQCKYFIFTLESEIE